jgi:hypothetical protein
MEEPELAVLPWPPADPWELSWAQTMEMGLGDLSAQQQFGLSSSMAPQLPLQVTKIATLILSVWCSAVWFASFSYSIFSGLKRLIFRGSKLVVYVYTGSRRRILRSLQTTRAAVARCGEPGSRAGRGARQTRSQRGRGARTAFTAASSGQGAVIPGGAAHAAELARRRVHHGVRHGVAWLSVVTPTFTYCGVILSPRVRAGREQSTAPRQGPGHGSSAPCAAAWSGSLALAVMLHARSGEHQARRSRRQPRQGIARRASWRDAVLLRCGCRAGEQPYGAAPLCFFFFS